MRRDARVHQVQLAGESKPAPRRLVDAVTLRPGTICLIEIDGRWRRCQIEPHPEGVWTSATVHARIITLPRETAREPQR